MATTIVAQGFGPLAGLLGQLGQAFEVVGQLAGVAKLFGQVQAALEGGAGGGWLASLGGQLALLEQQLGLVG